MQIDKKKKKWALITARTLDLNNTQKRFSLEPINKNKKNIHVIIWSILL